MGSVISVIEKIFKGIIAAFKWVYADNARLREAKARHLGSWNEKGNTIKAQPSKSEYIDVWDELDHLRGDAWLGGWIGRKLRTRHTEKFEEEMRKEGGEREGQV